MIRFAVLLFIFSYITASSQNELLTKIEKIKSIKKIDRLLAKANNAKDSAKYLELKGNLLINKNENNEALLVYQKSYELHTKLKNTEQEILLLNKISNIHIYNKEFSKVFDNQKIVANLLESPNGKKLNSSNYMANIALMYLKAGSTNNAKKHFHTAIKTAKEQTETVLLYEHYNNLSRVFIHENQMDSALIYCNKALKFSRENKIHRLTADILINKGTIFEKEDEFIMAEKQYKNAIELFNSMNVNTSKIQIKLGDFYKRVNLYKFADKSFNTAIKNINKKDNDQIATLYHSLTENALLQRKSKSALVYLQKYDSVNKIIISSNKNRNTQYIKERFEIQKEEIIYLKNKHELQAKETALTKQKALSKKNTLIFTILILFLATLFLVGLLYSQFYKLKNEKQKIQLKNTVLRLQMNPHFIFNSLTVIQNSVLKNDTLKSAELIAVFSKLIRQNLDYSNKKTITLSQEIDMLSNYLKTQKYRFDSLFNFTFSIDPKIDLDHTKIPPMLIQPFIENAIEHGIKHLKQHGKITISIEKKAQELLFTITDNGIGIKKSKSYNRNDDTDKIHAINIFLERLKLREKGEEKSFIITDVINNDKISGTKVFFKLKTD